jgi:hypothetical protein
VALAVAVTQNDYALVVVALVGLPQLALGGIARKRTLQAVGRALRLNG